MVIRSQLGVGVGVGVGVKVGVGEGVGVFVGVGERVGEGVDEGEGVAVGKAIVGGSCTERSTRKRSITPERSACSVTWGAMSRKKGVMNSNSCVTATNTVVSYGAVNEPAVSAGAQNGAWVSSKGL